MSEPLGKRLMHAWNAFMSRDPTIAKQFNNFGYAASLRQDRVRMHVTNERSVIISIYNRIALDVISMPLQHVRLDNNDKYLETIDSSLNYVLSTEANIDQTSRAFIQDIVMSMFDEGVVAIVPVDTTIDPKVSGSYEIQTMRVGRITAWYPKYVRIRLYNDNTGTQEEIVLPKTIVAIIENPLYAIMNEPNSTLKRLLRKLAILDAIDEQSGAGKLDLIIQLPYVIKTEARREQAETRRKDIEMQLAGSKYGIAYTDGTERVTQLNRPAENNLMNQIKYLTTMLYSQLGLTEEVFNGTADEATMLNYNNRTIIPILNAITDEFKRKFLTRTARTQKQSILYFKDAFSLVPAGQLAEIADKFTRNEVLTSNEVRAIIGYKPADDPAADELRNKNLNRPEPTNQQGMQPMVESPTGMISPMEEASPEMGQNGINSDQAIDLFTEFADQVESDVTSLMGETPEVTETIAQAATDAAQVLGGAQITDEKAMAIFRSLVSSLEEDIDEILGTGTVEHAYASQYYDPVKAHEYYMRTRELKGREPAAAVPTTAPRVAAATPAKSTRSTSGMSEAQRQQWAAAKANVAAGKKQQTVQNKERTDAQIAALRADAAAARTRISDKLKIFLDKLKAETTAKKEVLTKTATAKKEAIANAAKAKKEAITKTATAKKEAITANAKKQKDQLLAEKQKKLDAIPEIPKSASPEQAARMRAQNSEKKVSINDEYKTKIANVSAKAKSDTAAIAAKAKADSAAVSEKAKTDAANVREEATGLKSQLSAQTRGESAAARTTASDEKKVVSEKLKASIAGVREKAKQIKEALNTATEANLDREYERIMRTVAGKAVKS